MAYDTGLAQRIRETLARTPDLAEKKMFGGIAFMLAGNMACGVSEENLIVRVGRQAYQDTLAEPHVIPFDFTGRPMNGWVMVAPAGTDDDAELARWLARAIAFTGTLPAKG